MTLTFEHRVAVARSGTHAVVDLDALAGNVAALRARLPAQAEVMAVVKANAFGHGLIPCARELLRAGATRLGVARVEEALMLRAAGIAAPALVLGPANPALVREAAGAGVALAVGSLDGLCALLSRLGDPPAPLRLHLKIDTGMHRFGVDPDQALPLARAIVADRRLVLEGVFSHFATADMPGDDFMTEQVRRFAAARQALAAAGIEPPLVHLPNSAAALRGVVALPGTPATPVVRAGLALYGLSPSPEVPAPPGARAAMRLSTRLARVFTVAAGEGISYGRTFVAARPLRCATLPVGYGDGLSRHLSNRGWVSVGGVACPIRGRVSMDQTVIEVEAVPWAREGDEAVILGDGRDGAMTADEAAGLCGTINYEIVTALAQRVPRVYVRGGEPVAVADLFGLAERDS